MPSSFKSQFRKIGKKLSEETLEAMAQYFDILFHDESNSKSNATGDQKKANQNNSRQSSSSSQAHKGRPEPEDECPIHGHHKWKKCYLNPYGESYRAQTNAKSNTNRNDERGDQHNNQEQGKDDQSKKKKDTSDDANPYEDEFHENVEVEEPVPQVRVEVRTGTQRHVFSNALLDSGGSRSLIARSKIPSYVKTTTSKQGYAAVGSAGTRIHRESVKFDSICFPEFETDTWIVNREFFVFEDEGHSAYDLIIGRDILKPIGMEMSFKDEVIRWQDIAMPFTARGKVPESPEPISLCKAIEEAYFVGDKSKLKESDYDTKTTGTEIAAQQEHLSEEERLALAAVLNKFNPMFNQVLGKYPHLLADLKLIDPKVKPVHVRPFTVPDKLRALLKNELDKLVKLQVLEPVVTSAWAFPTFLIPKKDNTARFVSDFRKLNQLILDEMCPLPIIKDVLTRRKGFTWVTAIDLTSQFYHFGLTNSASELCTITTPFGLYRYLRLPMGVKNSPSFAQAIMQSLFKDMSHVECFIDDIALFTNGSFEEHMEQLAIILQKLATNGFSIKPKKCSWAVKSVEYLGHIITTEGVKPQSKKIDAILRLTPPTNPKQLRSFIGMVNYYRDHVRQRAHILAPLTAQTKNKKKIEWTPECQESFETIKSKLAQDALLVFPHPNFPFIIEPDASDYQLGSVILQNTSQDFSGEAIQEKFTSVKDKVPEGFSPVAYFSRKLTSAQRNYTVLEKELLSIVETLLEYRSFLLGRRIFIFTDHRNLTFDHLKSQRALRWRLIAEEFNITIVHRAGTTNLAADALSRLPLSDCEDPPLVRQAEERFEDAYLFYPVQNYMDEAYPLGFNALAAAQRNDANLKAIMERKPEVYKKIAIGNVELIHHKAPSNSRRGTGPKENWKIVIPVALVNLAISWFHRLLRHPGATRMYFTMSRHFYFPNMKQMIIDYVKTCDICQRSKVSFPGLGDVPPKLAEQNPWEEVQTDLIGPWEFKFNSQVMVIVKAITTIDPFLGICEIRRIKNKTAAHVATKFYEMYS
jgi:hypothetical protein